MRDFPVLVGKLIVAVDVLSDRYGESGVIYLRY